MKFYKSQLGFPNPFRDLARRQFSRTDEAFKINEVVVAFTYFASYPKMDGLTQISSGAGFYIYLEGILP